MQYDCVPVYCAMQKPCAGSKSMQYDCVWVYCAMQKALCRFFVHAIRLYTGVLCNAEGCVLVLCSCKMNVNRFTV